MLSDKILELRNCKNSLSDYEKDYIAQVLEKLPHDSRIVIFLHYWRDIEFKEIAKVLGARLQEVEFIHDVTLRLLSKIFHQKFNEQNQKSEEFAA